MNSDDNVVGSVTDAIGATNPAAATRFTRSFHDNAGDAAQQISALNRYWRTELGRLPVSTVSARTCLVDQNIEPRDWLRHFRNLVLPTILQHDLPRG